MFGRSDDEDHACVDGGWTNIRLMIHHLKWLDCLVLIDIDQTMGAFGEQLGEWRCIYDLGCNVSLIRQ
jgi:hypothetical protein